jgi:hypothetical protein
MGSFFVQAIITVLEKLARVQDGTPIRFIESKLDNKYTVGDIKSHYGSLYSTWLRKYPDPEEFLSAMLAGFLPSGLDWYAKKLLSSNAPPKFVVMGHTHHAESGSGYDNDGCWCLPRSLGHGDATPNYVVIAGEMQPWCPGPSRVGSIRRGVPKGKGGVVEDMHFSFKWFYGGKESCLVKPD